MKFTTWWVFGLLLTLPVAACGRPVGWEHKANIPNQFRDGLEIARNQFGSRSASLSLVCDTAGSTRLYLHTRLPLPQSIRREISRIPPGDIGHEEDAVVFVGGIERKIAIAVDVSMGEPFDEMITDPLLDGQLSSLAEWYSPKAPSKVSVVGIGETGVYMRGKGLGADITKFRSTCRPPTDGPV